ncbi:hypothetical protein SAMN04488101_101110 [Pedobacter nyackensis]|uniref:Uncharacterized protein n=1 Tax=Pedobacter nyackensis TaxID=475255 RepID=A0A1W1ZXM2_9SPHI|nr:hypothetical protein SAMN04488101_101110 [Pedobacter nyackensis]
MRIKASSGKTIDLFYLKFNKQTRIPRKRKKANKKFEAVSERVLREAGVGI